MKKLLLTGLALLIGYQCLGMTQPAQERQIKFDTFEHGNLSKMRQEKAQFLLIPFVKLRISFYNVKAEGLVDWLKKYPEQINQLRDSKYITPEEFNLFETTRRKTQEADEARDKAVEYKDFNVIQTSQSSTPPQISVSDEARTYEKLSHEATRLEVEADNLAETAYKTMINALNRIIAQQEEQRKKVLEAAKNLGKKSATEAKISAEAKSAEAKEELEPTTQPQAPSLNLSKLPERLDAITEGNEEEEAIKEKSTDLEEASPSTSGSTSMSSSASVTPRSSSPSVTLGVEEISLQENPEELQAVIIDERRETVVPIKVTSGSQTSYSSMPIFAHRQPRLLEEFKFGSPFIGTSASSQSRAFGSIPKKPSSAHNKKRLIHYSNTDSKEAKE
jgi:hypothetical protein